MKLWHKIKRRLLHLRLQPICVYVFHAVSDNYDPLFAWKCDWTPTEQFKRNVLTLAKRYTLISLQEAEVHLKNDVFRKRRYAVLTCDDGLKSLQNVLPWLEANKIPITLFVNAKYMDQKSWSRHMEEQVRSVSLSVDMTEIASKMYLSREEIWGITSPYISIASHGYEHLDARAMNEAEFEENVVKNSADLSLHPRYIPYYAFTWGNATPESLKILQKYGLTPIFCCGALNYNDPKHIDRILLDGKSLL